MLRTALKDHPKGPPTANRQPPTPINRQPPTTNRHQPPPTASGDQPPTANHCQPPPTTNHQPPTAANRHQPPVANRQPPTANMIEHMECPRAFLGKLVPEHFFFSVKDLPETKRKKLCELFFTVTLLCVGRPSVVLGRIMSGPGGQAPRAAKVRNKTPAGTSAAVRVPRWGRGRARVGGWAGDDDWGNGPTAELPRGTISSGEICF